MEKVKVLMVDDHPIIVQGYSSILNRSKLFKFEIDFAYTFDKAKKQLFKEQVNPYDIVFLDLKMPMSVDGNITSGDEMALLFKEKSPETKILILTMFEEKSRHLNLLNNVPHDGVLIKSETNKEVLFKAVEAVLNDEKYYTKSILLMRDKLLDPAISLDPINTKILNLIAKGIKTKDLPNYIDLSLSALEKRKILMKKSFDVTTDAQLIESANREGFI